MNELMKQIKENIGKVIVGKEEVIDYLLAALAAGGHVLLEDVPGTGKTVLAKTIAKSMDLKFGRVQFTPDLLPSDVTGLSYFHQEKGTFVFQPGPVFTNLLLADEINRATPRTQAALLECMEERQVSVDGQTRSLDKPFWVIATQNPIETLGCYPLPEAQLDRFLLKISMGNMSKEEERTMLDRFLTDEPLEQIRPVCTVDDVKKLQKECREVYVHEDLRSYMVDLVQSTRNQHNLKLQTAGVSPRGTLALLRASQGYAMVQGRDYVVPEDVKTIAVPVLAHRLLSQSGTEQQKTALIEELLGTVAVPTEDWTRA